VIERFLKPQTALSSPIGVDPSKSGGSSWSGRLSHKPTAEDPEPSKWRNQNPNGFAFEIKAHSEKSPKFDFISIKNLVHISEFNGLSPESDADKGCRHHRKR
jgi:hypothetical protein